MSHHHHHHSDECDQHECHAHECCHTHDHDSCHHAGHGEEDFAHQLLDMADEAWMCVLKDKIKEQIKSKSGAHLDKLAALVADANKERWDHKMAKHHVLDTYRDKLAAFFNHK